VKGPYYGGGALYMFTIVVGVIVWWIYEQRV